MSLSGTTGTAIRMPVGPPNSGLSAPSINFANIGIMTAAGLALLLVATLVPTTAEIRRDIAATLSQE